MALGVLPWCHHAEEVTILKRPVQQQTVPPPVLNVALHARILAEGTAKPSTLESALEALNRIRATRAET